MSEYTREEILKKIEQVGGPQNLDLSYADLSGIDLRAYQIKKELEEYRKRHPGQIPVWFSQVTGGINLRNADLSGGKLQKANLGGADLQEAKFRQANLQEASLVEAKLEEADLSGANLQKAHLQSAILQKAKLLRAKLQKANLSAAELQGADLMGADLQEADLWQADLQKAKLGLTNLSKAHLMRANLYGAHLEQTDLQEADLWWANLQKVSLVDANLQGVKLREANLQGAKLVGVRLERVDMYYVESLAGAYFHRAWLDQTRMTKEQLGGRIGEEIDRNYYEAKEAYLLLKNNFNQIGRYDDASWAYRKEGRMERMTHRPDLVCKYYDYPKLPGPLPSGAQGILHRIWLPFRKVGFHLSHLTRYLFDTAQLALCDFGENPWLVLIWAAAALFLFGLAYMGLGGIGPAPGVSSAIAFGDHFVYSLFAFATMDHPRIVATTGLAQFLTAFEALVGIFLAAIFVFTLGNRISRS